MNVLWDYPNMRITEPSSTVELGSKIVGIRRQGRRPNKVTIAYQEYKEAVASLGIVKVDTYLYGYLARTLNPRAKRILIVIGDNL